VVARFSICLTMLLLIGCGGGDPEPEPTEEIVQPPPKDICGPERIHCL
jgi:hypothetical protein